MQYGASTATWQYTEKDVVVNPSGFTKDLGLNPNQLWKLKKTVYGLKQSNREWVNVYNSLWSHKADENFYLKKIGKLIVICLTYVDDFLVATNNPKLRKELFDEMNKKWEVKNLGIIHKYLGMVFNVTKEEITINQKVHLQELLKRANTENVNGLILHWVRFHISFLLTLEDNLCLIVIGNETNYSVVVVDALCCLE